MKLSPGHLPAVVELTANECPPLQLPREIIPWRAKSGDNNYPVVGAAALLLDTHGLCNKLNEHFLRGNLAMRYGGGAYAVLHGGDLAVATNEDGKALSGVRVSPTLLGIDGLLQFEETTLALCLNATNWIYGTRGGVISFMGQPANFPIPELPEYSVYLGRAQTNQDTVTSLDVSGVFTRYQDGYAWRRTADEGVPNDTPPSGVRFITETRGGLYLWSGTRYYWLAKAHAEAAP